MLGKREATFPCPNCGKPLPPIALENLKPGIELRCAACGTNGTIQGDDITDAVKRLDDAFRALQLMPKRFGR